MALIDPPDTLAYHRSRPATVLRDKSATPLKGTTQAAKNYFDCDKAPNTKPEVEALWFYGMNHGMSLISTAYSPYEPLDPKDLEFVQAYYSGVAQKAPRAFFYLLMICTREARHLPNLGVNANKMKVAFPGQAGEELAAFYTGINGGEQGIHTKLLSKPPNVSLGDYCASLCWIFYKCSWSGMGGYGGPAWGKVADCLRRYVVGEFTAEMMLDTIWTLAHNNGPIFNKGICYGAYGTYLTKILDVQRSGQIPQAVIEGDDYASLYKTSELTQRMHWLRGRFPEIGHYVDWYRVEALGSVHKYPNDKKVQVQKYGPTVATTVAEKAAVAKAKAKADALAKLLETYETPTFEVMPGLDIPKVAIDRHAA